MTYPLSTRDKANNISCLKSKKRKHVNFLPKARWYWRVEGTDYYLILISPKFNYSRKSNYSRELVSGGWKWFHAKVSHNGCYLRKKILFSELLEDESIPTELLFHLGVLDNLGLDI